MNMKKLLEAVTKFSGEEVGQTPGDQWRGTDKGTPGKKLVGDSIIKDLSKGRTPKTKEQELAEEWAVFSEEDLGTHPKRAGRKSDRHSRGHEPQPRYKTVKANEGWNSGSERVSLPDEPRTYWNGTGALQKEYEALYEKLVPAQGAAETIEGEVLRAASKIVYRHFNDGDEFNQSSFDQLEQYIGKVTGYDDLAHKATEFAVKANGNYHPNQGWDSLDVMDYGPPEDDYDDEEEEDDDWYDDEDDLEEAKHFKTAYGWAGGRNEKTGGTYKHPDQIKADREAKKAAKAQKSKDSFNDMFGGGNPAKGLGIREGAEQDPIVAKVVKQMRPGLSGLNMGNEAFLYFAYELGKQRARDAWKDYLPAIRAEYEKGLSEGWESGPEEYKEPYDDADDAYDRQRQEKIDTEAEKEWAKLPKVSTYKLVGRGPNMEPNYEFGDEFDTLEQAVEYRAKIMKDPKTPYPEHIGIRTLTRVKDQTNEAVMGGGGIKDLNDYVAKRDYIYQQLADPKQVDNYPHFKQALHDLMRVARQQGIKIEESRAHKQLATWFKNREVAQNFATGKSKIPTPQERNDKIEKPKKEKVDEYGADQPTGTAGQTNLDPKKAASTAQATSALKSATQSSAPAPMIAKALDAASQGKPVGQQDMKAIEPIMKDIATVSQDPKLAGQFKSLAQQIQQTQLKQKS